MMMIKKKKKKKEKEKENRVNLRSIVYILCAKFFFSPCRFFFLSSFFSAFIRSCLMASNRLNDVAEDVDR